jgi:hypothetical protein
MVGRHIKIIGISEFTFRISHVVKEPCFIERKGGQRYPRAGVRRRPFRRTRYDSEGATPVVVRLKGNE